MVMLACVWHTPIICINGMYFHKASLNWHSGSCICFWTTTCFEAFIAAPGEQRYWEVNLAANGDWALYRFDGYRSGQTQQELSTPPTVRLQRGLHQLRLDARIALEPWWTPDVCPDLALTAVIDRGQEGLSHWALRHGPKADFHDRSTFLAA